MNRPWMPLYIADYLADTSHLNTAEHGAYLLLIMHYWRHDGLPPNEEHIRRITKLTHHQWKKSRDVLASLFLDGWRHKRCDTEIAQAIEKSKVNSANASLSHESRRANAERTQTQSQSHIQTQEKKEEETRARRAWPFAEFWSLFPNKVGKGAAEKAFRKVEKSKSVDFPFLLEALRRYAAKNDDRPWCNPATWLNQSRWTDEPAEAIGGKTGRQSGNSGGSLIEAIDEMRARLAGGQNQDFVQQLPARSVPGAEIIPGPGWDGDGAVRRGGSGARHEPTDWLAAEVQVSAKYRGSG